MRSDVNRPLTRTVFPGGWHFARGRYWPLTRTVPPGGRRRRHLARGRWLAPDKDRTLCSWAVGAFQQDADRPLTQTVPPGDRHVAKRVLISSPWHGPHLQGSPLRKRRWSALWQMLYVLFLLQRSSCFLSFASAAAHAPPPLARAAAAPESLLVQFPKSRKAAVAGSGRDDGSRWSDSRTRQFWKRK
jgi:hypothetical protein